MEVFSHVLSYGGRRLRYHFGVKYFTPYLLPAFVQECEIFHWPRSWGFEVSSCRLQMFVPSRVASLWPIGILSREHHAPSSHHFILLLRYNTPPSPLLLPSTQRVFGLEIHWTAHLSTCYGSPWRTSPGRDWSTTSFTVLASSLHFIEFLVPVISI